MSENEYRENRRFLDSQTYHLMRNEINTLIGGAYYFMNKNFFRVSDALIKRAESLYEWVKPDRESDSLIKEVNMELIDRGMDFDNKKKKIVENLYLSIDSHVRDLLSKAEMIRNFDADISNKFFSDANRLYAWGEYNHEIEEKLKKGPDFDD